MSRASLRLVMLVGLGAAAGCIHDWDRYDPRGTGAGGGTTTSTSSTGGGQTGTGGGQTGTGGGQTGTGGGGTGGASPCGTCGPGAPLCDTSDNQCVQCFQPEDCAQTEDCVLKFCCTKSNEPCDVDSDCCSNNCLAGLCDPQGCNHTDDPCEAGGDCCSGICKVDNTCDCKVTGTPCQEDNECCSDSCNSGSNTCN